MLTMQCCSNVRNICFRTALFTGKERDAESGNDYFSARYYSSNTGRFLSPDPSGLYYADPRNPQSLNLYSYVYNNPLTNIDPSGMECVWDDGSYDASDDPETGSASNCSDQGGMWVPPDLFEGAEGNQPGSSSGQANSSIAFDWLTPSASVNGDSSGFSTDFASIPGGGAMNNESVLSCASGFSQRTSIAGGLNSLGIGNNGGMGGFLTNALAGNVVSGAVDLFRGGGSMADVAFGGTRLGFPGGATNLDKGIAGVTQEAAAAGAHAAISAGGGLTTVLGGTVSTAGLTGAEYASGVGWLKFGYDALTYAGSLAACAAGVIQ